MQFRSCVEFSAIKSAAINASEEELDEIKVAFLGMKDAISDPFEFTLKDFEFHLSIIKASHNEFFHEIMIEKKEQILKALGLMNKLCDSRSWALPLHEKIMLHICARDSKSAIDLMKNNGEYNNARIKEFLNLKGEQNENHSN